jgi:predicted transcriptional regulator
MILRKRAWDIMREDFASVPETANMADVVKILWAGLKDRPDMNIVIVTSPAGALKGVITTWDVLRSIEEFVFQGESLRNAEEADWDKAFAKACGMCSGIAVDKLMHKNVPLVRPNDPLLLVVNTLATGKRNWAVVEEGGKAIGVILIGDLYREITREMVKNF